MTNQKLPQHFRFINPIIEVLRELGGSGRSLEVTDVVIEKMGISDDELEDLIQSGQSRIKNQIHWARMVLVKIGFIDSSQRGVWSLTEKGFNTDLSKDDLVELYKTRKQWMGIGTGVQEGENETTTQETDDVGEKESLQESVNYRTELLNILKSLSASGFERICQRLLRESGFAQVKVTGKSGDGGIDGHGILEVNPFVSFNVLFQCKRYQGNVSASQIRDFRGAMMGRADKGILITTGFFTLDAKKESRRDGAPPIEIIDGEKLIEMFERLELGLKPIKTFEVNYPFFEEFK
ncbi:MAG TPA: restriction endonuclease [Bacteroidales bacterium]|nr:restriction endonuclease [Bacteroidales bacterium]